MTAFRDLERLAREFANDLRKIAWDSGALGGDVISNLRGILDETLDQIKTEVLGTPSAHSREAREAGRDPQSPSGDPDHPDPREQR
jgi:hypothetical protein